MPIIGIHSESKTLTICLGEFQVCMFHILDYNVALQESFTSDMIRSVAVFFNRSLFPEEFPNNSGRNVVKLEFQENVTTTVHHYYADNHETIQ